MNQFSANMAEAIERAMKSRAHYTTATAPEKDAFLLARINAKSSLDDVDIRMHWNWFHAGWLAAHIWFSTIAREGSH